MKAVAFVVAVLSLSLHAQPSVADYERARTLRDKFRGLALNVPGPLEWIEGTPRFWYRVTVQGGERFVVVDALKKEKRPAFDHEKLAAAMTALGQRSTALRLPFTTINFVERESAIDFVAGDSGWRCKLTSYQCAKRGNSGTGAAPRPRPPSPEEAPPAESSDIVDEGIAYDSPQANSAPSTGSTPAPETFRTSPDGKWQALIVNFNVHLRARGEKETKPLSLDGSEGNYYTLQSLAWSPGSDRLVAYRVRPGFRRELHLIETSPSDQLQPKLSTRAYTKPGDTLDQPQPVLFHIASRQQTVVDNALFPNPYSLTRPAWWKDGRAFTFEYNQRGHQIYRVIEVDGVTGSARALISEESPTFFAYRPLIPNPSDTGKRFRYDIDDGKEILWMSERDGWAHLYLYDGKSGKVKRQITKGKWPVRAVEKVDTVKRQIWFQASGMDPKQDPYFIHAYRIDFDGEGLVPFTEANGNHTVKFSDDFQFYVDTWSRVDTAPVSQLRGTADRSLVMELERGDLAPLVAAGWRAPEVFTAPGRDGVTPIWGLIYRPTNFDPSKRYPVVEYIYNGPQGSFVPKSFNTSIQPLAEVGFIVVHVDGMGTNNRSKAFHDIAWKNLGDAGLPDRIAWHKAVAAKYPWYDISRVGIFGTSAGGQNAMAALLFYPEFYKAAAANSGCHDNRMDKIWWNEQWMSWPVGPHYGRASNVDNAHLLQGNLLLVVGELDTNVDPASTYQVANALIKANKKFDFLPVPSGGHGAGGAYYLRALQDFFVQHLQGFKPPDWNRNPAPDQARRPLVRAKRPVGS